MRRHPPRGRGKRARLLLAILGFVAACSPPGEAADRAGDDAVRVVDASGAEVALAAPARRIVSLVPSATQTLRAIGADAALIGRTDFDTEHWTDAIPSVGGGIEPNLEAIVALEPDLVIRFAGTQDARTPGRLDDLGIPHVSVRPDHVDDIYRTAVLLGAVTGHRAAADSLVASIQEGLLSLATRAAELPRLRVAYVLGGTPPWVSGPDTYIDEIVSLAGGDNVFADLGALYSAVSPEELRTRGIDVVLVSGAGSFDSRLTPGARVVDVGDALEIPGPDVVEAAYHVAELMHGRTLR
jgi:iron complex transport system substrate-binding protein